jgi:replicative DNA helicase
VRDKALLRSLVAKATDIADKAMGYVVDPQALAEEAEQAFFSVREEEPEAVSMLQAVDQAMEWADNPQQGLSTGFPALDNIVGGLRPEEFIIVAGRPSMGKSALAQCIAEHVAKTDSVLFCSLEMSVRSLGKRSLTYHRSNLGEVGATRYISALKQHIDTRSPLTLPSLRMRLRRHKRRHGLALLVVDYLQLMTGPKTESRHQEVGAISRGLKQIAKEFGIPVIAVASLNRGAEGRDNKRPLMSDLKESGDIESDADVVMMVYREEHYDANTEWKGIAEVIVRKHREGPCGTAYLEWRGEHTRFLTYHGDLPTATVRPIKAKSSNFTDFKSRSAGDDAA